MSSPCVLADNKHRVGVEVLQRRGGFKHGPAGFACVSSRHTALLVAIAGSHRRCIVTCPRFSQVEDYAMRKGLAVQEVEHNLAQSNSLGYDPEPQSN